MENSIMSQKKTKKGGGKNWDNMYLEYNEGNSHKFWEITRDKTKITTRWGKLDTKGQELTKNYGSKSKEEYLKMIESKKKKGYVLHWKKSTKRTIQKHKGKQYLIHDNGGRPFLVVINRKHVQIYKLPKDMAENEKITKQDYTELIKEYKNVKQVFIGKSKKPKDNTNYYAAYGPQFDGNTILIEIGNKRYCLISESIVEFSTKDSIEIYESPVGNNDVPYPLAYGTDNIYVFGFEHKYIPKETVENLSTGQIRDKYMGKCCPWKSELDKFKKKLSVKVIHKRIE